MAFDLDRLTRTRTVDRMQEARWLERPADETDMRANLDESVDEGERSAP